MAIIWEKRHAGRHYQVRNAGASIRLYTNGVFHSQFNPKRAYCGGVWDRLWLPALCLKPGSVRRVLLLGVGGGAVIRQLQRYLQPAEITAVDLDPVHLQIARRFFGVRGRGVRLLRADAVQWLEAYKGDAFDLVIDDLFSDEDGEPVRAVPMDVRWAQQLTTVVAPHGMLIANFPDSPAMRRSALRRDDRLADAFASALQFTGPQEENVVLALSREPTSGASLRRRLLENTRLRPGSRNPLRYCVTKLRKP